MKMTFSDIDEHVEDNETRHGSDSDISWKSDEYSAMISKATTATSGKKHRVIFQDEVGSKGRRERPKSACSIHQEGEGKVSRLYSLTRGQCRAVTRCNSALGLRRHEGRISRSPCPLQDLNEAETEKKYNIVNFKRSLKLLGFDPEEFGIESSTSTQKPRTKNVKPLTITRLERRTVSLDDVKKAVLNEFENDLRFPDNSHRQMLAKAVYEEWYFKKRDEALKRREQSVKQSKIRQWEREHDKNEAKKKSQETYEEWLQKKKVQQRMEKIKASSVMNSLNKRQSHQEKSELAFHTWKKEKEIALQKKLEDKKKEKQSQEEEEKERKRIEAEKAYNLWKRKTEEDMRRRKQQRERKQKEKKIYEALQVEERHRNAESSFRCWRQKKEQDMKEQMKRARRAKELSLETRVRMRDNQLYESNQAFMEWLDMIEERLQLQHLLDEKHKSKHPPWFPAGVGRPSSLRN